MEPATWTPLRGPCLCVDPLRGAPHVDSLTWSPICGGTYVEPPTWTLLHRPCLCGPPTWSPNVDSLTWTLLLYVDPTWSPLRGLPHVDPAYVDPLRGVDFLTWTLLMWTPPYMVGFQNGFSQNGALIAIPWGPASKSPSSSNHTQSTGMLNMKACQLQKL